MVHAVVSRLKIPVTLMALTVEGLVLIGLFIEAARQALYASKITSYAQGMSLLSCAS
jgi:6-phosphogluconate dehydrogenase